MRLKTESKFQFFLKWQSLLFVFVVLFIFTISVFTILAAQGELSYAGNFTEAVANDGSVTGSRVITLTVDTFAADISIGDDLNVTNVPAGLTAVIFRDSDSQLTLTLTGNATNHLNINDISDLTITFLDPAFVVDPAALIINNEDTTGIVNFENQASLSYSGFFEERIENDGSVLWPGVESKIVVTLTGDTFVDPGIGFFDDGVQFALTNVPAGFGWTFFYDSPTQATLILTDPATNHLDADDISNLTLTFLDAAFTTEDAANVTDYINNSLVVDFDDQPYVTYSGSFTEAAANDGSVTGSIVLDLVGDTFIPGPLDLIIIPTNAPASLISQVTRNSDIQVTITFTGNADNHLDTDDISDLIINCTNGSFTNTHSDNVTDAIYTDGVIDFLPSELTYSGSFTEAVANDGTVTGEIAVELKGDTFIGPFTEGVHYTLGNIPAGLTGELIYDHAYDAHLTLTGTATSHLDTNDIANLTITFLTAAFTDAVAASDVVNYTDAAGVIDFRDPMGIVYSGNFIETAANDGSLTGTRTATLSGENFSINNGFFIENTHFTLTNKPVGLVAVVSVDVTGQIATLSFTGNATNHLDVNDLTNLTITFLDEAFQTELAINIENYTEATGAIDFDDQPSLTHLGDFTESVANDGTVTGSRVVTLIGDTFNDPITLGDQITVMNSVEWLAPTITRDSDTQVTLTLTGSASLHTDADDVSDLTITFNDGAFVTTTVASSVTNYTEATGVVDFEDQAFIIYAGDFSEVSNADGSVVGSRLITITDDAFEAGIIASALVEVTNVPAGLTALLVRNSNIQLELTLTGNATNHLDVDDISNLTVSFSDGAFVSTPIASNVTDYIDATAIVDFDDQPIISYSGNFAETIANDGTVAGSRIIELDYDTFIADPTSNMTITNVPAGLTAVITIDSDSQLTLTLTGSATDHLDLDDISDLTITFLDGAFTSTPVASNVDNYVDTVGQINFADEASLSYSGNFTESAANDGSVIDSIIINLALDTFVDPITLTTHLNVTNVPAALTAVITRDGDQQLTLTLTGNATSHANANDLSDLTITFLDGAFTSTAIASNIVNYIDSTGVINFADAASLSYSGNFTETDTNNGLVTGSRVISLTSDTFVNPMTLTTHLNVTNVPAGLTGVITRDNNTQLTLTLTGTATSHVNTNDISNLGITFLNGAFTNTVIASNVSNYTDSVGIVDFKDASGGSISLPVPSSGSGESSSFVDMETESNMMIIDENSRNFLLYINSLLNFQLKGDTLNSYTAKIQNLNMIGGEIEVLFNNGQLINLFIGDLKQIDINGDSQADISVKYNELKVNRIDLTFTKLSAGIIVDGEFEGDKVLVFGDSNDNGDSSNFTNGILLKVPERSVVYLLEEGKIRPILNEGIFRFYGFSWGEIIEVNDLSEYLLGEYLTLKEVNDYEFINGDLLKEVDKPEVYILENGKKRHIVNQDIFKMNGFRWSMIYEVANLEHYPLGEVVGDIFENNNESVISAVFGQDLQMLMQSDDVKRLQTLLASDASIYPEGVASGYFGFPTKAAVVRFQIKHGIAQFSSDPAYGRVESATRAKLLEVFGE